MTLITRSDCAEDLSPRRTRGAQRLPKFLPGENFERSRALITDRNFGGSAKRFGDALVDSPEVPMGQDRIVAVGFLTDADLRLLGERFDRYFPVEREDVFADLIAELDKVEAIPFGKGVSIQRKSGG